MQAGLHPAHILNHDPAPTGIIDSTKAKQALDRNVSHPRWSMDGRTLRFIEEGDEAAVIAEVLGRAAR